MEKIKNPSNKNSIPSIIISDYDENQIKEIKVKYLKLARLDKITIKKMTIDKNIIHFDQILFNGQEHPISDKTKIEFDHYVISGKIEPSKKRITLKRDGKEKIFFEHEGFSFVYKEGDEKIEEVQTKSKYILTITDKNLRDKEAEHRYKSTERELPSDSLLATYKQISGFDNLTSKDIYKIKRYIDFKNEMMFYFQFIEEFFQPLLKKGENFFKFKIYENGNEIKAISLIKHRLNDDFKNQPLATYIKKNETIKHDFIKIQQILGDFRHALAHFDFDFIQKFFDNGLDTTKYDISTISLIETLLQNTEEKIYQEKNNYIEDTDTLCIYDEKEIGFSKLHNFYTKISQKKPAFNKLINTFLSKDGVPNEPFKAYLHGKGYDYFEDIHADKVYKAIYVQHKALVAQKQKEEAEEKPDGQKLKSYNDKLQELKMQMDAITKANSLKRLEVKLRLAFGFIATTYNYNFKQFNQDFTQDVKTKAKLDSFKATSDERLQHYFESTFEEKQFFHFIEKDFNKKTKRNEDKKKTIFNLVKNETLQTLVQDNPLLQIITLLYLFIPKELQGDFIGFISQIYHQTKNITSDTKEDEISIEESQNSFALKLKVLAKTLRGLQLFNYSLSHDTLYETRGHFFYEKGNRWKKIYSDLQISHNTEEFDIHLVAPIIKYHINLYKLIGDFEIYALLTFAKKSQSQEKLSVISDKDVLKFKGYYNFSTLLSKAFGIDLNFKSNSPYIQTLKQIRNDISHQNLQNMMGAFEKKTILSGREVLITELQKKHSDMPSLLHYNPINDFTMKTVQYCIMLDKYKMDKTDNEAKIENRADLIIKNLKKETPNDYYLIYKLKAIELMKQKMIEAIGETAQEKKIRNAIANERKINIK